MKSVVEKAHTRFSKLVRKLANNSSDQELKLDMEVHKKLLSIFQVGDYYYYAFNLKKTEFDFMSPEIEAVLGYKSIPMTVSFFLSLIHPDDLPWFVNFENKVTEFFLKLKADDKLKYKVRYDYRVKKSNGEYLRILQQVIVLHYDRKKGGILRTFGIHTDITHLKKDGKPVLSLIGIDGAPSYVDIDVDKVFMPSRSIISQREKQVLHLLIEGKHSGQIAEQLFISQDTVSKHRQNMLRKTNTASTAGLVAKAVKMGWI